MVKKINKLKSLKKYQKTAKPGTKNNLKNKDHLVKINSNLMKDQISKNLMIIKKNNMIMAMVTEKIEDLMIETTEGLMIEGQMIEEILVRKIRRLTPEFY